METILKVKTDMPEEEALELLQKSEEWLLQRLKKMTSSEHHRLMAEVKRQMTEAEQEDWKKANPKSTAKTIADPKLLSDGAMTYILEVVGEILTGQSADSDFSAKETQWGVLYEPEAQRLYQKVTGLEVQTVGIRELEGNKYVAGSPDGLIGTDGGNEVKCPFTNHNHLKNLLLKNVEELKEAHKDYYWQCLSGMLINKRKWWDFVSYSPNFPGSLKIKIIRINIADVMEDLKLLAIKLKYATKEIEKILETFKEEE